MHEALHPITGKKITVAQYVRDIGRLPVGHKGSDPRPPATCPFCHQTMSVVGDKSDNTVGHFSHKPKSGFCPSKEPAGKPYLELSPRMSNPIAGKVLKSNFRGNWVRHYRHLESLVPALHFKEFLALLELAEKWRVWEYAGLAEAQVPYVFLALADFTPASGQFSAGSPKRKYWLRFMYDSPIRRMEDLWISPSKVPSLHRVSYKPPLGAGRPSTKDLLKSSLLNPDYAFLGSPTTPSAPLPWLVTAVEDWFNKNW